MTIYKFVQLRIQICSKNFHLSSLLWLRQEGSHGILLLISTAQRQINKRLGGENLLGLVSPNKFSQLAKELSLSLFPFINSSEFSNSEIIAVISCTQMLNAHSSFSIIPIFRVFHDHVWHFEYFFSDLIFCHLM